METGSYNPYVSAKEQLNKAADILELNEATKDFLKIPMREFHFTIPIEMDNGVKKIFRAYRIVHNDARGPAKGGIRFHPQESIDTIRAMAMWMTWKTAVADLPLGGSKGVIICDPHNLSQKEQERLCRGWVRQMSRNLGENLDIASPEIMSNAQHMLWMLDEHEIITGKKAPGFITGKPVKLGGSLGRIESAGYGVAITIREALKELNLPAENTTASVQGFGSVAQSAIELYHQLGGKVVCVSNWEPNEQKAICFCKDEGIILEELKSIANAFGEIDKEKAIALGYQICDGEEWLNKQVEILIPAAVESAINEENVQNIQTSVKLIAEAANGSTTYKADEALRQKGIFVIPDFLANAGGVICSYFEQVQSNMNYYWSKDEVLAKLDDKITAAYIEVSNFALMNNLSLREAAYVISVDKVAKACSDRGWV
ncbi:MAG: Glu/Leu/Phe/Val dehydrogenase [Chloroflexia bacterium]|nr:Glu/Leu/Phe/Val dehydrogenase [Chloroflexia bacterium]